MTTQIFFDKEETGTIDIVDEDVPEPIEIHFHSSVNVDIQSVTTSNVKLSEKSSFHSFKKKKININSQQKKIDSVFFLKSNMCTTNRATRKQNLK